jgi:serine/threonine protein kinase
VAENPADVPRNRFQIIGQLGRGALAEVYLCKLRGVAGFEKEVVVKRISSEYAADPLFVRMFLDEARVAARLTHPNIVQVFEVGEEEGVPYIAMEYVRGVTLGMVIRRAHQEGKIHYGHFAQIIAKICEALAYAHSAVDQDGEPVGLVHREVSPANIVINLDGIPKLLDFGMAAAKDRLLHTQEGMLTGELRYMAPEQVSRGRLDHRADVFSLGITLFELTTGINPFGPEGQGESEVLDKVLNAPIPRPSQVVPAYPPTLEKIVMSAIERNVDKRCPSAREFRERLEVFAVKKEHLSTPRSLAAWVRELFPDFATLTKASEVTAPRIFPTAGGVPITVSSLRGPTSGSMEAVQSPLAAPTRPLGSPLLQQDSGSSSLWKWAAFGASGLAIAVAIWAVTRTPPAPLVPPSSTATAPIPSAPPPAGDGDAEAKVYIEAAEVFAGERRFDAALEMANKAATITIKDKTLSARLATLLQRISAEQAAAKPIPPDPSKLAARPTPAPPTAAGSSPQTGGPGRETGIGGFRVRQPVASKQQGGRRFAARPDGEGPRPRGRPPVWVDPRATGRRIESGPPPRRAAPPEAPPVVAEAAPPPAAADPAPPAPPAEAPVPLTKTETAAPPPPTPPAGLVPARREAAPPAGGRITSRMPKDPVPIPTLPREHVVRDDEQLARVCQVVEGAVISLAGLSPDFARGITGPFRRRVRPGSAVYPIAMYYFIVREAGLRHDNITAANNLAAAQSSGVLLQMRNFAGFDRPL